MVAIGSMYMLIAHCLMYFSPTFRAKVKSLLNEQQLEEVKKFAKKNKRHFYFKKNTKKPVFQLKRGEQSDYETENDIPIILLNSYDSKTGLLKDTKIVVYKEKVKDVLRSLHYTTAPDGTETCCPGGINALSKIFNRTYHYRGNNGLIKEMLRNFKTCKVNNPLPKTQEAPPKPIRSYGPLRRVQYDLIDMAPKSRSYMAKNAWGYRYVLSVKCCFSKFCWLFPLKRKEATEVYLVIKLLFEKEGFQLILQSDNGKEFVNKLIKNFLEKYEVKIVCGGPRHPKSQGQVENLNKLTKQHLRRYLQNLPADQQGKVWPLLLPGIADRINATWCSTIDDIPFRVFKNREPNVIRNVVISEDEFWSEPAANMATSEEQEEDGDEFTFFAPLAEENADTVGSLLDGLSSSNEVSHAEILQTCVGASLSSSTFQDKEDKDLTNVLTEDDVEEQLFEDEEEEFSTLNFNRTLFQISKNWHLSTILNLLESTEYTIHRNIEHCLKKTVETKFEVGDKILMRNPTRSSGSIGGDPLVAPNVIRKLLKKSLVVCSKSYSTTIASIIRRPFILVKWYHLKKVRT